MKNSIIKICLISTAFLLLLFLGMGCNSVIDPLENATVNFIGDTKEKQLASSSNKTVYHINVMTCEQCGTCYDACPDNAIIEIKLDGKTTFIVDPDLCTNCGMCINVCKFGGMEIVPIAGD